MTTRQYKVIIEPNDDEPGFTATVPALQGCVSVGDTQDDALANVRDAIELWIEMARKNGEEPPTDETTVSTIEVAA